MVVVLVDGVGRCRSWGRGRGVVVRLKRLVCFRVRVLGVFGYGFLRVRV